MPSNSNKKQSILKAAGENFLGNAPDWYKRVIFGFLLLNPVLMLGAGASIAGWAIVLEFIFTLAMALRCYPLPAGGLIALEALLLGLTSPGSVYQEVQGNLSVILLLIFMVAGIHFMKDGLVYGFSMLLTRIRSKIGISLLFCALSAFLSAFLDALTVTAVIMAVAYGFYDIYHRYASQEIDYEKHEAPFQHGMEETHQENLMEFRGFLRNLMMHSAIGTALGGAATLVGEPQNLLIGTTMGWDFVTFFKNCAPVSLPVMGVGFATCALLEVTKSWGYGYKMPELVRQVMVEELQEKTERLSARSKVKMGVMAACGLFLIGALGFHIAEVGLVGLTIIVLLTAFNGVVEESPIGHAFEEAMPFTALLVVFFSVVAVIHDQHLFSPIIHWVLTLEGRVQLVAFFVANGVLSAISDNVFVATVYIKEVQNIFEAGKLAQGQYQQIAVAINMGTNIPSVATPNGQAAFLFLLTSSLAPLIRLSYMEMVKLAFPYAVVMSGTALLATMYWL